jgi:hypothetical protein
MVWRRVFGVPGARDESGHEVRGQGSGTGEMC